MVRHSAATSIFKVVVALLAALVIAVFAGATVPASAHDGSGSNSGSNSGPSANSGPGNANCHPDNSGPGSANSGPGMAECPMVVDPGTPGADSGSDSTKNPVSSSSISTGGKSATQAPAKSSSVVVQAQAPTTRTAVPTVVEAGVPGHVSSADSQQSPSPLALLTTLLGLAMTGGALVRRHARA